MFCEPTPGTFLFAILLSFEKKENDFSQIMNNHLQQRAMFLLSRIQLNT